MCVLCMKLIVLIGSPYASALSSGETRTSSGGHVGAVVGFGTKSTSLVIGLR